MPQTSVSLAMAVAFDGMQVDGGECRIESYVSEEAADEIPFGVCVKQGTADDQCLKLTAITDKLIGITVHSHAYQKDVEIGTTGVKPKMTLGVAVRGQLWVPVEEAVTPASDVHVRAVAAGAEVAGAFRDTADGADTIDISAFARFKSTTTGAGRAILEFDFTNRGADKID